MKIEDSFTVAAPQQAVWAAITNPDVVGPCIPGCKSIEVVSPTLYKARVGVAVGPIKASFNVEVEVLEEDPPNQVRSKTRGEEGSRASTISADNLLRLEACGEDETRVHYLSEVSVVGRLGKFGMGVMKKKAEALGRQFAECFRAKLEAAAADNAQSGDTAGEATETTS